MQTMTEVRVCLACGVGTEFYGSETQCKTCKNARVAAYRRANPEKCRAWTRQSRYGVSAEQYNHMLGVQGGACAVCREPEERETHGKVWALSVDHDHLTGRVRGLVCDACNKLLGLAQDNPGRLEAAAAYLDNRFNF